MFEFLYDFINHLQTCSLYQIFLFISIFFIIYGVEKLINYNTILYGSIALPNNISNVISTTSPLISFPKKSKKK